MAAASTYHRDPDVYFAREIRKEKIRAMAAETGRERLQHEERALRLKQIASSMRRAYGDTITYRDHAGMEIRGRRKEPAMKPISAMTSEEYLFDLMLRIKDAKRKAAEADNEDAKILYEKQADVLERILERENRARNEIERRGGKTA